VERNAAVKFLCDFLAESTIIFPLESADKWSAIEACIRTIPQIVSGTIPFDAALASIRAREEAEQPTMMEGGVAIPHGILPDPAPLMCALGVSPGGFPYNSAGTRAYVMFVLLGSVSTRRDYLGVLAQIARHFRGPVLKDKILGAASRAEILSLIRQAENV